MELIDKVVPRYQEGGSDAHLQVVFSKQLHEQKHTTLGIHTDYGRAYSRFRTLKRVDMGMLATYIRATMLCVHEISCPACSI